MYLIHELIEQKENVRFLKDLFVYKDFELNGDEISEISGSKVFVNEKN